MDKVNSLSNVRDTIHALALNSELELLVIEAFYDSRIYDSSMVWTLRPVPVVIRNAINEHVLLKNTTRPSR